MLYVNIILLIFLILLTAFFVATEFAIVKARSSKIEQLKDDGNTKADAAIKVMDGLDEYLSACQLGITITALGLGWLGEPTVERILHPVLAFLPLPEAAASIISFVLAFILVTYLHVVIGELAPKTFAIQKAEALALTFAKPIIWFYKIMYPFIWLLNGSARMLTRLFGIRPASEHQTAHTEEELRIILSQSLEKGEINKAEYDFVNRIFAFDNRSAGEIMIPRTEMITVSLEDSIEETVRLLSEKPFTRYPVIREDKDDVIGLIHAKEVLGARASSPSEPLTLSACVRPMVQVIQSTPLTELLVTMRKEETHMAVLLDEYGGTAGIITVEDILEEIVGEMRDELDIHEEALIQPINEQKSRYLLDGKVLLEEVNKKLELDIEEKPVDTLGGWLLSVKPDIQKDETVTHRDWTFIPRKLIGRQIKSIEAAKKESPST
ncbi:hemolysin family protein [Salibacterium halotolerans]|uniref:Hemolysin, contains CBS domains n=1 Tax=Salibacterium halotolerans TaxID=1884432 RepID=A0A1I5XDA6_9BACI|nr:hemolysin family protein [Salibacterium halotolerans]SFQ29959.1 Hemolysin, contains CBS domains [Salibacterium halotolerans]